MPFGIAYYKATKPLPLGIFNLGVRWWTHGKYSHTEMLFSDGLCGSSTFHEKGVRVRKVEFLPGEWDFHELDPADERAARQWFEEHDKDGYSEIGLLGQVIRAVSGMAKHEFCSEALAAALGYAEAWRFYPALLACVTRRRAIRIIENFTAA